MHEKNCNCEAGPCRKARHAAAVDAVMAEFGYRFGQPDDWDDESRDLRLALTLVQGALMMLERVAP